MSAEKLQAVLDLEAELAAVQFRLDSAKAELDPAIRLRLYGVPKGSDKAQVAVEALSLTTGAVVHSFATLSAAAKMGFTISCIRTCLKGEALSHKGLFWRRVGDTTLPELQPTANRTPYLRNFIAEFLYEAPGVLLPFGEFYDRFIDWLPPDRRTEWSRIKVSRSMPMNFPSGTGNQNRTYVINASFEPGQRDGRPYCIASEGRIKRAD